MTVVTFANGVEAWFKPTDFKNDEILFSLSAPGGASLAAPEKFIEALVAPNYVGMSGVGGHSATDLQRLLAGKRARVQPVIGAAPHMASAARARRRTSRRRCSCCISGSREPGDDPQQFALMKRKFETAYANRGKNPTAVFGDKLGLVNTSGHYTAQPVTVERLSKLDREEMVAFYRERYSNAADFTFFMVGAFKLDEAIPVVGRYVGSLPSTGKPASKWKDIGGQVPRRDRTRDGGEGNGAEGTDGPLFAADPSPDADEQSRVSAADGGARDRDARHPARGARRDL